MQSEVGNEKRVVSATGDELHRKMDLIRWQRSNIEDSKSKVYHDQRKDLQIQKGRKLE